jgi:hypothetical protein
MVAHDNLPGRLVSLAQALGRAKLREGLRAGPDDSTGGDGNDERMVPARKLHVELDFGDDGSISGIVTGPGMQARPFGGWLELVAIVEQAATSARQSGELRPGARRDNCPEGEP